MVEKDEARDNPGEIEGETAKEKTNVTEKMR